MEKDWSFGNLCLELWELSSPRHDLCAPDWTFSTFLVGDKVHWSRHPVLTQYSAFYICKTLVYLYQYVVSTCCFWLRLVWIAGFHREHTHRVLSFRSCWFRCQLNQFLASRSASCRRCNGLLLVGPPVASPRLSCPWVNPKQECSLRYGQWALKGANGKRWNDVCSIVRHTIHIGENGVMKEIQKLICGHGFRLTFAKLTSWNFTSKKVST